MPPIQAPLPLSTSRLQIIQQYIACLESANAQTIHRLKNYVARDIRLTTPVGDAHGVADFIAMIGGIHQSCGLLKMRVYDFAVGHDHDNMVLLKWDMQVQPAKKSFVIAGVSDLTFAIQADKIVHQQDIWNPLPLYAEGTPLFSWAASRARKKLGL